MSAMSWGSGGCAFVFGVFRGFDDDHESHFVCPFGLSRSDVLVQSLIDALPIRRTRRRRIDKGDDFFGGGEGIRRELKPGFRSNMAREAGVPVSQKAVTASSGHSGGSFRTVRLAALNLRA